MKAGAKMDGTGIGGEEFVTRHSEQFNEETLAAMQEALDMAAGKIKAKQFNSFEELLADLMSDDDD